MGLFSNYHRQRQRQSSLQRRRWRVKAFCWLPWAQSGDSEESVSASDNVRDAWPCTREWHIQETGLLWCVSSHPDQGRRRIQNGILNVLQPIQIPGHAIWSNKRTSYIPVIYWWLPTAIHCQHCSMVPRRHTHLFDKREGGWDASTPSVAATQGIQPLLQSREVSIWSLRSWLPGVCPHSWHSHHEIGQDLHNCWVADTEVSWRWLGAPWVHELVLKIYLAISQDNPSTNGSTTEMRDISWQHLGRPS